jgi:hypothetical protein
LIAFVRGTQSIVWTPTARIAPSPLGGRLTGRLRHTAAQAMSDMPVAPGITARAEEIL